MHRVETRRSRSQPLGERPGREPAWPLLLGVWIIAFGLRSLYLWQISSAPFFDLRLGDAEAYHLWGRRIADGEWLGQGVFYQSPLYPYFLGIVYRIFGDGVTTVRLIQAAVGATSCGLLAAAGMSLFGRAGAIAGLGLAVYPPAIFLDGLLEKSPLVSFFTAALLAGLAVPRQAMTAARWFIVGTTLGLLALTRENALLLGAPILLLALRDKEKGTRPKGQGTKGALAFFAGCAIILAPVAMRNLVVGGELHLTTSQFGPNFYIGNHRGASGTYEALVEGHGSAADERDDAVRLAEEASGRALTPKEVSSFWTGRAIADIRSQPGDWMRLLARKLGLVLNAREVADTESQDVYADWSGILRLLGPFDFGALLALGAFGTVLTARRWRQLWWLYAIGGTYAFSVMLFYVFARYRFPIVLVLMVLAAGGLAEALTRLRSRSRSRSSGRHIAVAAAAAVLAVVISRLPLDDERAARATHYTGIATALSMDQERHAQATAFYLRALELTPNFPQAHFGLGTLLARLNRSKEAIPHYEAALRAWPSHPEAHYNLGLALAATEQPQKASFHFAEAIRAGPGDADMQLALAKSLLALKQPDGAAAHYQQAVALEPSRADSWVGLGVALTELGRTEEAMAKYARALELDPGNASAHNNLGFTLANEGRVAEAVTHFERALELNPADENARRNLEQARRITGR
jgi:tetratricopeptide (TPR) repeat protein